MSVRKNYSCDLCGSSIDDKTGIGIIHRATDEIRAVYLHQDGAGRHICNRCIKGLKGMLAGLDELAESQWEYDAL